MFVGNFTYWFNAVVKCLSYGPVLCVVLNMLLVTIAWI